MSASEPIGLIAGWGRFPVVFAQKARDQGIPVVCMAIRGMADGAALAPFVHELHWTRLAAMNRPIKTLLRSGVRRFAMAGKIHKTVLFRRFGWWTLLPDLRMLRFWLSHQRRDNKDDSILRGIIAEMASDGLTCESALTLCPELLVRSGLLTRRKPTSHEDRDIAFGWELAKEMGRLDVGQSVAVRNRAVLAVEAIEGTDEAIRRAGKLCPVGGFVVVKVAKPEQDMRFDVPTIGTSTIETMHQAGAKVLAVEAGKTILLDEAETIALADRYGITIVSR